MAIKAQQERDGTGALVARIGVGALVLSSAEGEYLHTSGTEFTTRLLDAEIFETVDAAVQAARDWIAMYDTTAQLNEFAVRRIATEEGDTEVLQPCAPSGAPQLSMLPDDAGTATSVESGLTLNSPGEAQMVAIALRGFAGDLKKLAKGLRDVGKAKEAQACEGDASVIMDTLLPQLEPQAKLPFGYADIKAAVSARISGSLRAKLASEIKRDTPLIEGDTSGKERQAKIDEKLDDFESLVGHTASIVTALVEPMILGAAERGMLAGRMVRETAPDVLALEAVSAVFES